ncbi:MAG TPA: hypothetical protein VGB37_14575 [Candidatus Lokiarchaeia archaeon]
MKMQKCLLDLKKEKLSKREIKDICRVKLGFKTKNEEVIKKNFRKYL